MAKYVIEDTTLTGIADAIRGKTGGAAPIPVTDMATQIAAITGGGSVETLTTIFEEQTVEGFAVDTESGIAQTMINTTSSIVVGESYKVLWDGTEVALIAEDLDGMTALLHEECGFCVQYLPPELMVEIMGTESGALVFVSMNIEATSHTVGIYQKVSSGDSGGAVEGIVYVTFKNGDVELCKTACMKGDSTVDPLEDGKIAVPTKEPTVSTVYTYAGGWSLTDGGEADAAALVDVTEDRTVYAVYAESAREYTINFWIAEGELHESLQVAYGETPSPSKAEKNGYCFDSWTPELTAVTGDADYTAVWSEASPWETVAQAVANGTYKSVYKVGDLVPLDLGDYGVHDMEIVAFDTDEKADGSGKAAITWLSKDLIAQHAMNPTDTNANGWVATEMRTWLRSDVFAALPADVQSAIVPVNKTYYDYTTSSTLWCEDTVWLPSYRETFGNSNDSAYFERSGVDYTSYFTDNASRIKYYNGSGAVWWLRSTYHNNYSTFRNVDTSGSTYYKGAATLSYGVALGFCT